MSKYAKEAQREHIALVRWVLIQQPDASFRAIAKALEPIVKKTFHHDYIGKLVNKIHAERVHRYNFGNRKRISELEDHYKFFAMQVRKIIQEDALDPKDKIAAIALLFHDDLKLFEAQQNAGVFARAPEKIEVTHGGAVGLAPFTSGYIMDVLKGLIEAGEINPVQIAVMIKGVTGKEIIDATSDNGNNAYDASHDVNGNRELPPVIENQ